MQKINKVLNNNNSKHIFPFLWIHGEDATTLRSEIKHIYDSGIRSLCVEARPHNDFNGPKWFEDLCVILETCKELGMEMWLLDDSHFPTGFANGEVQKSFPHLQKKYCKLTTYDFCGPIEGSGACLKYAVRPGDKIIGVYLQKRVGFEDIDVDETIDVTDTLFEADDYNTGKPMMDLLGNPVPGVHGKVPFVRFDLPEGNWSLNILSVSIKGGEKHTEGYLNPIVPEATDVLLNTVYKPVYQRFSDDFGKTFRGFFSDEPRFGNIHGAENASIGRNSDMVLPWRGDLPELLWKNCQRIGGLLGEIKEQEIGKYLSLLFIGKGKMAGAMRYAYMDLVSGLYSEHFDKRIADWCHEHNCEHIGHTIEDNEAAARLGYGAGHIFRAMEHADMAGIDVVIHQLLPGMDKGMFKGMHKPGWDGEFFTYLLGKFGGSLAHLDPKKRGRCMCELFGAYGWAEGNRLGKWLADYMMVRGVNNLVPHAFDCAPFPNGDCPPHFCAEGKNPQYPEFKLLMEYCERICELLSDGTAVPDVALYFNAEGEWCGDYQPTQKAAAALARGFADYDLISADYLGKATAEGGKLCINGMSMNGLVIPWAETLPGSLLRDVLRLAQGGVPVWFVDGMPKKTVEGDRDVLESLRACEHVNVVALEELMSSIHDKNAATLVLSKPCEALRGYHYKHDDGDIYFFVNESTTESVDVEVTGIIAGNTYSYDAFDNKLYIEKNASNMSLPPYGSKIIVVTGKNLTAVGSCCEESAKYEGCEHCEITEVVRIEDCRVSAASFEQLTGGEATTFVVVEGIKKPEYLSSMMGYETFSGRIRYEFSLSSDGACRCRIVPEGVREGVKVLVNDKLVGTKIVPEYAIDAELVRGDNSIVVEVNTTLGRSLNDFLSSFMPIEPAGISGIYVEKMREI